MTYRLRSLTEKYTLASTKEGNHRAFPIGTLTRNEAIHHSHTHTHNYITLTHIRIAFWNTATSSTQHACSETFDGSVLCTPQHAQ